MSKKFVRNYVLRGKMYLKTGLHIGGLKEDIEIGGIDSPIITTSIRVGKEVKEVPYIPGSSLKGKMRSLLEITYADDIITPKDDKEKKKLRENGYVQVGDNYIKYESEKAKLIPKLFGIPADTKGFEDNISRVIVRDAFPTEETLKNWEKMPEIVRGAEVKAENAINRITSRANPRSVERIPADSEFEFEIVLRIYENDNDKGMLSMLLEGMKMLEDNYLGGFGSRGYGKIEFKDLKISERDIEYYEGKGEENLVYEGGKIDEIIEKIQSDH